MDSLGCIKTALDSLLMRVCVCTFAFRVIDPKIGLLCEGNQVERKRGGHGLESGQAKRWSGWGGEAGTVALWVWKWGRVAEEVEQQRRAGVAPLSRCSQHLLLGQYAATASLCLACVRLCMCVSGEEQTFTHERTRFLPLLASLFPLSEPTTLGPLLSGLIVCVYTQAACVFMSGVLSPLTHFHPVNHRCPG